MFFCIRLSPLLFVSLRLRNWEIIRLFVFVVLFVGLLCMYCVFWFGVSGLLVGGGHVVVIW